MHGPRGITTVALVDEGRRIADEGARRGLTLKLFGGVAFYMHARDASLFDRLGRDPIRDLDFVGRSEERTGYKQLFDDLGYEIDWDLLVAGEGRRFLFQRSGDVPVEVDLFIDRLEMCHTIDFRRRLLLHPQTLSLVDLLLQKLQIVDLNRKDMVDVVILLTGHDFGSEHEELIDLAHAVDLLSDDWGFYFTATRNIERIKEFAMTAPLDPPLQEIVQQRLERVASAIEGSPKTRRWKLRARVGTRKKWYQDVEEDIEAF
ncbi:MAG: hypothetical protein M3018_07915 [Actinomycetota bacterium]|nr:hypothetical protein [Actinomycetota bacterium]